METTNGIRISYEQTGKSANTIVCDSADHRKDSMLVEVVDATFLKEENTIATS